MVGPGSGLGHPRHVTGGGGADHSLSVGRGAHGLEGEGAGRAGSGHSLAYCRGS